MVESRTSNHVSAVAVIPVEAGHLNSEGMVKKGKYEIASAKRFRKGGEDIPYVSAQALRKYIRDYMEIVVNQPGYYQRVLRKTTKKDPVIADPVEYFEDDYLGISHPLYTNPNDPYPSSRISDSTLLGIETYRSMTEEDKHTLGRISDSTLLGIETDLHLVQLTGSNVLSHKRLYPSRD